MSPVYAIKPSYQSAHPWLPSQSAHTCAVQFFMHQCSLILARKPLIMHNSSSLHKFILCFLSLANFCATNMHGFLVNAKQTSMTLRSSWPTLGNNQVWHAGGLRGMMKNVESSYSFMLFFQSLPIFKYSKHTLTEKYIDSNILKLSLIP